MGNLVSPILSETLAMPFAMRWKERHAWEEREARLSIVDDAGVDGVCGEGFQQEIIDLCLVPRSSCSGPARICPIAKLQLTNENQNCAITIGHE